MMHTKTAKDLAAMVGYQIGKHRDGLILNFNHSSILSEVRQETAKAAVEAGAEWLLFVDSDMRFPKNTLEHLLAHDVDVVAANCSKRKRPIGPTARVRNAWMSGNGQSEALWPDENKHGLEEVETVGFGLILIRASVFRRIGWPWFSQPWVEEHDKWVGEDVYFCGRLHEAGISLYVDHDLSWHVKHIGDYEFGMQDVLAERALVEAGAWEGWA